jgi:hypothetical protein
MMARAQTINPKRVHASLAPAGAPYYQGFACAYLMLTVMRVRPCVHACVHSCVCVGARARAYVLARASLNPKT